MWEIATNRSLLWLLWLSWLYSLTGVWLCDLSSFPRDWVSLSVGPVYYFNNLDLHICSVGMAGVAWCALPDQLCYQVPGWPCAGACKLVSKCYVTHMLSEKHKLPYQAIRYRGYMIMTNRVKLIIHMTLNGIRPDQVLSKWYGKLYMIRYDKAWSGDLNMVRWDQAQSGGVKGSQVY